MADINQTITLGIGTPAGVPEFLTLGLQIAEAAATTVLPQKRLRRIEEREPVRMRRIEERVAVRLRRPEEP